MNITHLIKSNAFITSLLVSGISLGMIYMLRTSPSTLETNATRGEDEASPDSIIPRKAPSPDSVYRALLNQADQYYQKRELAQSLAELEKAQKLKPGEASLNAKMTKIRSEIADQKQKAQESQKSVASGDAYFNAKDYLNAKASYQMAIDLNPDDPAAREKLRKTMELLRSQKASNILYDVAVASADKLFQAKDYTKAMQEYENASKILPGESYPKNKINEIIKIQVDAQVLEESYARAIASGDKLYLAKNYPASLVEFKTAGKLKPAEKYPQEKIKELTALLDAQRALDDAYVKAIAAADQSFVDVRYPEALKGYQEALVIKPEQAYPKNRIREIEGLLARERKANEDYEKYIASADSLYIEKNFLKARDNYLMASSVKPKEQYPKEMIAKTGTMLTGQEAAMAKALEEQYTAAVAMGDQLLAAKSYEPARSEFLKASNLKPLEQYPKDRIQEIEKVFTDQKAMEEQSKLAAIKAKDDQYKALIASGNKYFAEKSYEPAKSDFQQALLINPKEFYPKSKIEEIDRLLEVEKQAKATDSRYRGVISMADSLLALQSYEPARNEYQNALKIKPGETYPKEKISLINSELAALAKMKSLEDQYKAILVKADNQMAENQLTQARVGYEQALKLKPGETYPAEKLMAIDKILAGQAVQKELDDRYKAILASADKLLTAKSYEPAMNEFSKALEVKPEEQYPKDKIAQIEKILSEINAKKTLDEQYSVILARADQLLADKAFELAKTDYQQALVLKPAEAYPKTKIAEADQALAAIAKEKELELQYQIAIEAADRLLVEKSYADAKGAYQAALKLKPAAEYPKTRIAEIDIALADLVRQKALDDQYAAAVTEADRQFTSGLYLEAKSGYEKAILLKPNELYPKQKIEEAEKRLADLAAQQALDEQYKTTLAAAEKLLSENSYEAARKEFVNAGNLKPGELYPKEKIAGIDKVIGDIAAKKALEEQYSQAIKDGDRLLAEKSYESARSAFFRAIELKPGEAYPTTRLAEIEQTLAALARQKALDEQYQQCILSADKFFAENRLDEAKVKYQEAIAMKPAEQYPKTRITEIDAALAAAARQKALDDQYAAEIVKADQLLLEKSYDLAKSSYAAAGTLKPGEAYPKEKILEIDKTVASIIAAKKAIEDQYKGMITKADQLMTAKSYEQARTEYIAAGTLKPGEQYPKDKVIAIDGILEELARKKALDDEYAALIISADKLFGEKSFELARTDYQKASQLKPSEGYPKTRMTETEKALADVARRKAIDDQYAAALAEADRLFGEKTYDQAKTAYLDAGKIKPSEQYPKEKVTEINALLAEIARQKTLNDQYSAVLAKADQLLASKSYDLAKVEYGNALKLKPEEAYPKTKIVDIESVMAELKAIEDAFKASVLKADQMLASKQYEEARTEYQNAALIKPDSKYPSEKMAEINRILTELKGKKQTYDDLITKADEQLKQKEWIRSKDLFTQASIIFPEESYPKERVGFITAKVDSIYRANKSFYDKAVADGDRFFNAFEFDKAVDAFNEAAGYLPMENYPKEMISKIRRTIAENAIVDVLQSPVTIVAGDEKQFSFAPVNMASRKNNYVYIKIRNLSEKPFNILMRYGKDKQANGGVVIRNVSLDGKVNERLVSVKDQDLWYREDNNWISLYPQGGDIEVSFIQVSRSR
jgi:tetratricopeptide (TPR) repeat protein